MTTHPPNLAIKPLSIPLLLVSALISLSACTEPSHIAEPVPTPASTSTPNPSPPIKASTKINTSVEIVPAQTPIPSPTVQAQATAEPSARPTPAPSASATVALPVPSTSPTPSSTPTPSPTPTPVSSNSSSSGSSSSVSIPTPAPITVVSVTAEAPPGDQLTKGQVHELFAFASYSNQATSRLVSWQSSAPAIASVTQDGQITAHRAGTVTLVVTSTENPDKQTSLALTVVNPTVRFGGRIVYVANNDLYVMKGNNLAPLRLTNNGDTQQKLFPRLAWDGLRVVYSTPQRAVFIISTDGSGPAVDQGLDPNQIFPSPFIWDSGEVLFQAYGGPTYGNTYALWIRPPVGLAAFAPTPGELDFFGGLDYHDNAVFAQNGHVLKISNNDPGTLIDLGPGQHPKIPLSFFCNQFVYERSGEIIKATYAGQITQLTTSPAVSEMHPAFSPAQEKIVFVSNREGNQDIYMMNSDGSKVVNLTNTPDIDESMPDWSM